MIGQRILLVGAHADDVELNAGGSIHKWRAEGRQVHVAVLSAQNEQSRHCESREACMHLDVDRVYALGGHDTRLRESFNVLLERLEAIIHAFAPDAVFTHFHADTHQDHVSTYEIAIAAARKVSNFLMFKPTYPSGRPNIPFQPNVISLLSKANIAAKGRALGEFASQRGKYGDDRWGEAMESVARGDAWTYAGVHGYAEIFQLGRLQM
ncbi:MAG: PIG-L deacetylase family protein [Janthinobacterium lividum]